MSKISQNRPLSSGLSSDSTTPFTQANQVGKCALFCVSLNKLIKI